MKKHLLYSLIIFDLFFSNQKMTAQMVYIPDSNFRVKLTSLGYGACITGDSINSSCSPVNSATVLHISYSSITDLQGIQAFTSLNYLDCRGNNSVNIPTLPSTLDTLDASSCMLPTIAPLPGTMIFLNLSSCGLSSLPTLPASLQTLKCEYDSLTSLPILPSSLLYLFCSDNQLISLPSLPSTLRTLFADFNLLTSLPTLPNLRTLSVMMNQITSLPTLPQSLNYINCGYNSITALPPVLPDSIAYLSCGHNQITSLPTLPLQLYSLDCGTNLLTVIPTLPAGLSKLICNNNSLTALPTLPGGLTQLYCYDDLLTALPVLPNTVNDLMISNNSITNLLPLPTALQRLQCDYNLLISLPQLPSSLELLNCSNNSITSLPSLPPTLYELNCSQNLISSIPELPDSMIRMNCNSNPNLYCLPRIKIINDLNFGGCPVTCVPNYGIVQTSSPNINALPLCDALNPNGCQIFWNISGKTYFDVDSNCVNTLGEIGLKNVRVLLFQNGTVNQMAFTGINGRYSFDVNTYGNYDVVIDSTTIPFSVICPASGMYQDTISASDSLSYNNDFAAKCADGVDLGVASIVTRLIIGRTSSVAVIAGDATRLLGLNCADGTSATLTVTMGGNLIYIGPAAGALTPSNVSGNVITYNIPDVALIDLNSFVFNVTTDSVAPPGSMMCFVAFISSGVGDINPANDSLAMCFPALSSFDPNEKEVYPAGVTDTSIHWLTYTLYFQNTGTAPALNIYLLDTLDSNFDLSTFQVLSSSHECYAQVLSGHVARFNFPNINLPDSTSDEPHSHGYVQYKIKLKDNLPIGTQIRNTAYIYFDFNAAVVTNTTLNTIDIGNGVSIINNTMSLNVWPVPFDNHFFLQTDVTDLGSKYSIVNLLGSEMKRGEINSPQLKINTEAWTSGIYFLRVESKSGLNVRKLIKK